MRGTHAVAPLLLLAAALLAGEMERSILAAHGLPPDQASLSGYLRRLRPAEGEAQVARELVASLASAPPGERHRAVQWLGTRSGPPLTALKEAAASADPDVRRIGERLLQEALDRIQRDVLVAVLQTTVDEGIAGLAEDVLGIAPLAAELRLEAELAGALRATLTEADLPRLREAAAAGDLPTRCAAVRALGAAPGALPDEAAPYAGAREERLRVAAALAFADRGDRRCVPLLGSLLDAEDTRVRRDAAGALALVRGPHHEYDPLAAPGVRRAAAAAWRARIAAEARDAAWPHPLPVGQRFLGRTLVALYRESRLIELDAAGRTTFEVTGLRFPWGVQGMPDGRRIVTLPQDRLLIEYDGDGKEAARLPLPDGWPGGFHRAENGHTFIAMMNPNRIVEVDRAGEIMWQLELPGTPFDVQRLENGHLLVCIMRPPEVVELDAAGRVRWSLRELNNPMCARRLPNGNTLVADTGAGGGRAAEYDREGRVVWEKSGVRNCYSLQRLPDGGTLVADMSGVREIAPDGTERWILRTRQGPVRASRY